MSDISKAYQVIYADPPWQEINRAFYFYFTAVIMTAIVNVHLVFGNNNNDRI